jgi:hypothetical protein
MLSRVSRRTFLGTAGLKATPADPAAHNREFLKPEDVRTAAHGPSISSPQFLSGDDLLNLGPDRVKVNML